MCVLVSMIHFRQACREVSMWLWDEFGMQASACTSECWAVRMCMDITVLPATRELLELNPGNVPLRCPGASSPLHASPVRCVNHLATLTITTGTTHTHTHTHTHTVMNLGVVLQAQIFLLLQQLILHHTMYAPYYLYIMTCGDHLNHTQSSIKHPRECAQNLEVLCEQSFFVSLLI